MSGQAHTSESAEAPIGLAATLAIVPIGANGNNRR